MHLIEKYEPKHVSAVLDCAHCAVDCEPELMALDIVWSHLSLVNFKSSFHMRVNGPEELEAVFDVRQKNINPLLKYAEKFYHEETGHQEIRWKFLRRLFLITNNKYQEFGK